MLYRKFSTVILPARGERKYRCRYDIPVSRLSPMKGTTMPPPPKKPSTNPPAHEIRLNGVQASIWQNDTPQGPRFNTTFRRNYRDGEEWKSTDSFGRDDLLTLGFVATESLRWIMEQKTTTPSPSQR